MGKVSSEDYERVLEPLLDELEREGRRVRFLYQLGPEFDGFTPGAAWEDAKAGLRSLHLLDGCALVSDAAFVRETTRFMRFLLPCPVRVFDSAQWEDAVEWLRSLPQRSGISQRLLPELGVVVVEVVGPIRKQDFDQLEHTAQPWLDTHGELEGLVIRAREFPGWETLASFLRHASFVRRHHRKVKRVALAADTKLAGFAQRVVEQLVKADIRTFRFAELEDAIAWAAGPSARSESPPFGAHAAQSGVP